MPHDSSTRPPRTYRPDHVVNGAPFPRGHPSGFATEDQHLEPQFDPAIHLDLQAPAWIKPLISEYSRTHGDHPVTFPLPVSASASSTARSLGPGGGEVPFPGLAFTSSFRVLSDAGVQVLREIIARQEKYASGNDRQAKSMRGLGFRSKFVRDFTYCPQVLDFLSRMSGCPMHPQDMAMNVSQINFGEPGSEKPVDKWHLDSVPFVMVVLLSDATDMVGGELQVARIEDPDEAMRQVCSGSVDPRSVDTVNYPGPGHAILMQGSRIAHTATSVSQARETRLTLVNSYQTRNPFADVATCYRTFKLYDPDDAHPLDVARHFAWRASGQLDYLIRAEQELFERSDGGRILALLDSAAAEIKRARDFVSGAAIDEFPYQTSENDPGYQELLKRKERWNKLGRVTAEKEDSDTKEEEEGEGQKPRSKL